MPSRGLKHAKEIAKLRAQGLSDGQIAKRLSVGKSIIARNLFEARTKQRLAKLLTEAGLYSLRQVVASCELSCLWVEIELVKLTEGKSSLNRFTFTFYWSKHLIRQSLTDLRFEHRIPVVIRLASFALIFCDVLLSKRT
jgi:hypothetical protein